MRIMGSNPQTIQNQNSHPIQSIKCCRGYITAVSYIGNRIYSIAYTFLGTMLKRQGDYSHTQDLYERVLSINLLKKERRNSTAFHGLWRSKNIIVSSPQVLAGPKISENRDRLFLNKV